MLSDLIKNRSTEKDIRDWLGQHGFDGKSVDFLDLELHAIQRPGWVQVFRFTATARRDCEQGDGDSDEDQPAEIIYGAFRGDERARGDQKVQVNIFSAPDQQAEQLESWSEDLISLQKPSGNSLAALAVAFLIFAIIVSIALNFVES